MKSDSQSTPEVLIRRKQPVIFWIFILIAIPATLFTLFYSAGYRYHRDTGAITRTSALSAYTIPRNAVVSLNGEAQSEKTPFVQTIPAGTYRITISKDGYQPWQKVLGVEPGRSLVFSDVVLFFQDPRITSVSKSDLRTTIITERSAINGDTEESLANELRSLGFENPEMIRVFRNGPRIILVDTRVQKSYIVEQINEEAFDKPVDGEISNVYWIDRNTLAYTIQSELWIYSVSSGSHDLLVRQTAPITSISAHETGSMVYYSDESGIHVIERDPRDRRQIWNITTEVVGRIVSTRENGRILEVANDDTAQYWTVELYEPNTWYTALPL